MVEQLDIFSTPTESTQERPMIRIYDKVKVRPAVEMDDVETFYYLKDYEGRSGQVIKRTSKRLDQYEVEFNGMSRNGIFNASELVRS